MFLIAWQHCLRCINILMVAGCKYDNKVILLCLYFSNHTSTRLCCFYSCKILKKKKKSQSVSFYSIIFQLVCVLSWFYSITELSQLQSQVWHQLAGFAVNFPSTSHVIDWTLKTSSFDSISGFSHLVMLEHHRWCNECAWFCMDPRTVLSYRGYYGMY